MSTTTKNCREFLPICQGPFNAEEVQTTRLVTFIILIQILNSFFSVKVKQLNLKRLLKTNSKLLNTLYLYITASCASYISYTLYLLFVKTIVKYFPTKYLHVFPLTLRNVLRS